MKHNQRSRLDYISRSLDRFNLLDGTKQNGVFWSKCPKDDPLSHSASSATSSKYRDGLNSLRIALDLSDGVEMLEVILEENEHSHDVARSYEEAIIAFVCFTFLLSPMQLVEIKLNVRQGNWKLHKCTTALRTTFQILCVNGVLLGLRLGLFFAYGKDASIFIAKNCIVITLSLFEICSLYGWCGCED